MPFQIGYRENAVWNTRRLKKSPLARGLVFCAVPCGNTFIDLVTGAVGTTSGNVSSSIRARNGGASRLPSGVAVDADGSTSSYVVWPESSTLRGASLIQEGTILCLGGTTEQVDGKIYVFGGNTQTAGSGNGFGLAIDSYLVNSRGPIIKTAFSGGSLGNSGSFVPLGTTAFGNKTHLFGYSFNANGVNGTWFGGRQGSVFSGKTAHGTSTTSREAIICQSSTLGAQSTNTYVRIFLMWDRELSVTEYTQIYDDLENQIFEPEPMPWFIPGSGTSPQLLAPTGEISGSTWIASNGGTTYSCVDEATADGADYAYTMTPGAWVEWSFEAPDSGHNGSAAGGYARYQLPAGSGSITVTLRQGASVLETYGPHTLTGSTQDFAQLIAATTSNSTDLRLRFTAS